ncbi:MAG: hypothetical protein JEZ06_21040 [Anaerolineaceae bacterium]|nr:hypothetical protein [Anaerolineaceae bacterium]
MKNDDDNFETLISAELRGEGSMQISFPVPPKFEKFELSTNHVDHAIQYYLLARYAYFHRMNTAFMMNSFWAVEHLILSILVFKYDGKEDLKKLGGYHSVVKYWEEIKTFIPDAAEIMGNFDGYLSAIQGYFSERYPGSSDIKKLKLVYSGKKPAVLFRGKKQNKFGKVASLNLDDLDHFINFLLHDLTSYSNNCSDNLMQLLASQDNTDLYKRDNNFSVIFPNKQYHGEFN